MNPDLRVHYDLCMVLAVSHDGTAQKKMKYICKKIIFNTKHNVTSAARKTATIKRKTV